MSFPIIIKPRWASGSRGLYQANTMEELDELYQKSLHFILDSPRYKHESEEDLKSCIIMQEKIEGAVEYGLDILDDFEGNYVTTIAEVKFAMRDGSTNIAETVDSKRFENVGKIISKHLRHVGNLDIDCFLDAVSKEPIVIDMNCRFGGHYCFCHLAGANFPKQIVEWLLGNPTSSENITCKCGIKGIKDESGIAVPYFDPK